MARTKFTPENTALIVSTLRAGGSFAEACRTVEVRQKTAEGWLTRGRRETEGPYAAFAKAVADAREEFDQAGMDEDEFDKHLARAVRAGSVQAMKLWWQIHGGKDPDSPDAEDAKPGDRDPFTEIEQEDELAEKRAAREGRAAQASS